MATTTLTKVQRNALVEVAKGNGGEGIANSTRQALVNRGFIQLGDGGWVATEAGFARVGVTPPVAEVEVPTEDEMPRDESDTNDVVTDQDEVPAEVRTEDELGAAVAEAMADFKARTAAHEATDADETDGEPVAVATPAAKPAAPQKTTTGFVMRISGHSWGLLDVDMFAGSAAEVFTAAERVKVGANGFSMVLTMDDPAIAEAFITQCETMGNDLIKQADADKKAAGAAALRANGRALLLTAKVARNKVTEYARKAA